MCEEVTDNLQDVNLPGPPSLVGRVADRRTGWEVGVWLKLQNSKASVYFRKQQGNDAIVVANTVVIPAVRAWR